MYPEFYFSGHSFKSYALFYLLGFYAASIVLVLTRRGKGKSIRKSVALSLYLLAGVFVFSKLVYLFLHFGDFLALWKSTGLFDTLKHEGLAAQGGLLGGILVLFVASKLGKESFWTVLDDAAPAVALGQGIGRIGCYLAGCCRGTVTSRFFGVVFPDEGAAGIFRHPVQLYESFLLVCLFLFLMEWHHKARFDGEIALMYLFLASPIRFFVEYFRWGVSAQVMWGVITQAQMASLGIIVASLYFMRKLSVKQKTHVESIIQA